MSVEQVTIPASNTGPTLEEQNAAQEAAAKAKADESPKLAGEENPEERPAWLPEKFKTPEDMAKAYAEAEKKLSGGESAEETQEAAEQAVESAGLDMEALSAEWQTNGELTKESLDKLAAVGITEDMVQMYVAGQEATQSAAQAELLEPVGGSEEAYNEMIAWAADNLEDGDIDAYNKVLESGNQAAAKMAVQNLAAKYSAANGQEPGRQIAGKGGNSASGTYESTADLMKDMQNPEYESNPAFRAKVQEKLGRSSIM